jgi:RNA recognition motif-containing protein
MKTLYIGNLAESLSESALREMFSPYGDIVSVKLMTGRRGRATGVAYVEMATEESASAALQSLRGTEVGGHRLDIVLEEPPEPQRRRQFQRGGRRRR